MSFSYFALYRTPDDADAFDEKYFGTHVPIVDRTPGLVEARLHKVARQFVGEPAYYLLAELVFNSEDAFKAAAKSPEWAESGANLQEWGGMSLVTMFSARPVPSDGGS